MEVGQKRNHEWEFYSVPINVFFTWQEYSVCKERRGGFQRGDEREGYWNSVSSSSGRRT